MNLPFHIRADMLAALFGIADEAGVDDETVLGTVNVRLDQMFRMVLCDCRDLVIVHREELDKVPGGEIRGLGVGWELRELKLDLPPFNPADGIPEEVVSILNDSPKLLAKAALDKVEWGLIQSPMLRYAGVKVIKCQVYTRVAGLVLKTAEIVVQGSTP
jgi:hypothetical protein